MEKFRRGSHEYYIEVAEVVLSQVFKAWRDKLKFSDILVTWPSRPISADDGSPITDHCLLPLPATDRRKAIVAMVGRTDAHALLLLEKTEEDVYLLVETPMGTKSWRLPIEKHGDVRVLGSPTVKTNVDKLGLLYSGAKA